MMRIGYFDTAKGVGMLLVIISHTFPSGFGIQWFCESFHMPLFFFISGFFFSVERYSVKEFLQRRFKQLIIPLACFSIIVGLIYTVCYGNLVIRKFVLPDTLWFLWVLFIVEVLYMLLMRLCGSVYSILIVSVSVFMCSQLKTVSFPDPFYVKALGNAFCFYSIGNMFSKYKLKIGFNSYNESCCKIGLGGVNCSL